MAVNTDSQTTAADASTGDGAWTLADAAETYSIDYWSNGYFAINDAGHVVMRPDPERPEGLDLKQLVDELYERDILTPVLIRFDDILRHRLQQIHQTFYNAIREFDYKNDYHCIYPIKVNQQRHVVEQVLGGGKPFGFGLEAGSKPELLAVMAMVDDEHTPIVCNGFKDDEFIEAVILASKVGKNIIPVVEKFTELRMIVKYAKAHDVKPRIGVRVKLAARGAGRWEQSGGIRSKFGLFISEVLDAVSLLREHDMLDCLQLLHFHLGSQINNISSIKSAIIELTRVYVELQRAGTNIKLLDVGGGLGVDYDGSKRTAEASINYSLQEYANDVVYYVKEVCDQAGVAHPTLLSESGRATTAYHSVLIFNVMGHSDFETFQIADLKRDKLPADLPRPIKTLVDSYRNITVKNMTESFHDAQLARDEVINLFNLGYCSLEPRALAEKTFFSICARIAKMIEPMDDPPDELANLPSMLSEIYFCNMSIFQSMPDSWAIDQLFPVMPIHRLNEEPGRRAILADITCDSDGKIDHFISRRETKTSLEVHTLVPEEPYYLGVFLVGAYQEILGDLHNLLGDTNAVHVNIDKDGEASIEEYIEGDTVREVLSYVQFSSEDLKRSMRRCVERAVREKRITISESRQLLRFYESGLEGYTYLE